MNKISRKTLRLEVREWLETPEKVEYRNLMDKMEAADLRSLIIGHAIQKYRGNKPVEKDDHFKKLQSYYSQPIKYQKEILVL